MLSANEVRPLYTYEQHVHVHQCSSIDCQFVIRFGLFVYTFVCTLISIYISSVAFLFILVIFTLKLTLNILNFSLLTQTIWHVYSVQTIFPLLKENVNILDFLFKTIQIQFQIKNVLFDNKIQLTESLIDDILAKMTDANRDGKYKYVSPFPNSVNEIQNY